jgi:hypothetical protein
LNMVGCWKFRRWPWAWSPRKLVEAGSGEYGDILGRLNM